MKLRWRFGVLAGIILLICGIYPQLKLWYLRGDDWQGAYAYNDIDEVAYAAYLRALMDGRPRKNDPYTGRDDTPESPQPESLFSIQFAAPYSIAVPARVLGVSVSTAMTAGGGIAAFLAGLALFWLIGKITDDSLFALAGTLIVVCGGALAAGEGAAGAILDGGIAYPYFPAFRRYVPAMPFPVFWAFCGCVWALVTSRDLKKRVLFCVLAAICFSFLVFSYFYIWTAAAAWLGCLALVWLVVRPDGWLADFKAMIVLALACCIPLGFYALMLSNRSHTMDDVQLLVMTRTPDLLRVPQMISIAVLVMLLAAVLIKAIDLQRPTLFILSLSLSVIVVFNQQIFTGRSLQPVHYQVFIGNYVAGLALVLTLGILWRGVTRSYPAFAKGLLISAAVIAAGWGLVECHYTVLVLEDSNVLRDKAMPLARRLQELSKTDTPSPDSLRAVVLPTFTTAGIIQGDDLPTVAPQAVLWARHLHVFSGVTWQENKERYYQYLYYMNLDERWLEASMMRGDYVSIIALFGWGRHGDRLTAESKPLTYREVREEAGRFADYRKNFGFREASRPTLSYLVAPGDWEPDFTNLDVWYERDAGEKLGDYTLYKLKLKPPQ